MVLTLVDLSVFLMHLVLICFLLVLILVVFETGRGGRLLVFGSSGYLL